MTLCSALILLLYFESHGTVQYWQRKLHVLSDIHDLMLFPEIELIALVYMYQAKCLLFIIYENG